MTRSAALVIVLCVASCGRRPSGDGAESRRPQLSGSLEAGGQARGGNDSGATAGADDSRSHRRWQGTYRSESATIFVPPEWKGVSWSVPPTSDGLGEGTLNMEIEASRVSGSIEGPLGPASIDGVLSGSTITASVVRRDPGDHGYAGTLIATLAANGVHGTMNLSLGEASAVRTATFSVASLP